MKLLRIHSIKDLNLLFRSQVSTTWPCHPWHRHLVTGQVMLQGKLAVKVRPICGLPRSHHDHHVFKLATSHSAPLHLFRISATKTHVIQRYPRLSLVSTSSFTCQRCTKHTRLLIVIHPRKQKKTMPKTPKGCFPGKFLHHLCHYVVIVVFNEMDCQIIELTWGPPPTPGMVWSFYPPPKKKNDQTRHRFSGFVVLPEILPTFGEPWVHTIVAANYLEPKIFSKFFRNFFWEVLSIYLEPKIGSKCRFSVF